MSIISGIMASTASEDASSKASASAAASTAANTAIQQQTLAQQQKNFDLLQTQEAPYRAIGEGAASSFTDMLNGKYNMSQSPSAAYAMQQGTKQVNNALQTRGLEGNAVQQMGQLGSSVAASDYQNRFNNLLNALNVGTAANAGTASATNNMNSNLQSGANSTMAGNTAAAGITASAGLLNGTNQANIIGGSAGQMLGAATNYLGNSSSGYTAAQAQGSLDTSMAAANSTPAIGSSSSYLSDL